jgi:penicillin-binding protein 1A
MSEWQDNLKAWAGGAFARLALWLGVSALALAAFGAVAVIITYLLITPRKFDLAEIEIKNRIPGVTFYDARGELLATRGAYHADEVALKEMPPYLPSAFIAIEDRRFYSHWGISFRGILRAVWVNLRAGETRQGGSTITQQLARNIFLSNDKTISRKLKEVLHAVWLERHLTKDQILTLYLNRIYFGAGTYGVDAASRFYFGKSARCPKGTELKKCISLAEAAMLAGLPKAPTKLSPSFEEPESAQDRAGFVLESMVQTQLISAEKAAEAIAHPACAVRRLVGIQYYLDYVYERLAEVAPQGTEDLIVETTLNKSLQEKAERAVATLFEVKGTEEVTEKNGPVPACPGQKEKLEARANASLKSNADQYEVGQAALVSIDPQGAVRAMVGGRSYIDSQFNRATTAQRQPGSAFKPFVYVTALERGYTPDSIVDDAPITISTPQGDWSPTNYTDFYRGPVTLREALRESLNTVAVRLSESVGPEAVVATAHRLGILSPLEPNHSVALGSEEVNLLEMTSAFLPFARSGLKVPIYTVRKVATKSGKVVFEYQPPEPERVMDETIATEMTSMMYGVMAAGTGRNAWLGGRPAAGKTGTSSDWRDAWFMGYTAQFITGVWVGNDDDTPMKRVTGGGLPAAIWKDYMVAAHLDLPVTALPGGFATYGGKAITDLRTFYIDLAGELGAIAGSTSPPPTEQPAAPPPKKRRWPW